MARRPSDRASATLTWRSATRAGFVIRQTEEGKRLLDRAAELAPHADVRKWPGVELMAVVAGPVDAWLRGDRARLYDLALRVEADVLAAPAVDGVTQLVAGQLLLAVASVAAGDPIGADYWQGRADATLASPPGGAEANPRLRAVAGEPRLRALVGRLRDRAGKPAAAGTVK